jgi:hypothetical protein
MADVIIAGILLSGHMDGIEFIVQLKRTSKNEEHSGHCVDDMRLEGRARSLPERRLRYVSR